MRKRQEFPEEGEVVLCTVTKILPHAVFAKLEEYDKSGLIHISEIAPGRIRNIRDYVKEDKVVVCKVLGIDIGKGHIDLSLRRVNDLQKRQKVNQVKQEQKAEKIIEFVSGKTGIKYEQLYDEVMNALGDKYDSLHLCFEEIVSGKTSLEKLGMNKKTADDLEVVIKQRIKLPDVTIKGMLSLTSYKPNGIEIIKEALKIFESKNVLYLGAGKYMISITAGDYKTAEKELDSDLKKIENFMEKHEGTIEFKRQEEKK